MCNSIKRLLSRIYSLLSDSWDFTRTSVTSLKIFRMINDDRKWKEVAFCLTCCWAVAPWSGWCSAPGCCPAGPQISWSWGRWSSSSSCGRSRRGREVRRMTRRKNATPLSPELPPCSSTRTPVHRQTRGSEEHRCGASQKDWTMLQAAANTHKTLFLSFF